MGFNSGFKGLKLAVVHCSGLFQRVWRPIDQSLIFQAVEDTSETDKFKKKIYLPFIFFNPYGVLYQ